MIIDLERFMETERPFWFELERFLERVENEPGISMRIEQLQRFHYLYERTSSGLAKLATFSSETDLRRYLESLVARAYGEIHETRGRERRVSLRAWFFHVLPQAFRRHLNAFWLVVAITLVGCAFGGFAVALDPEAKAVLLPAQFANHLGDPAERVAAEEQNKRRISGGQMATFSAELMQNNIAVSIKAFALGMSYGIGTILVLFYNGILIGLIAVDYVMAGQTKFLLGWLLPHGVIEIPAIMIAGQAGLVLANALLGWGSRQSLKTRFREISSDLLTLIAGVAVLLVWAGLVEAFLSQYHEPVIPYVIKILFGLVELVLLCLLLGWCGAKPPEKRPIMAAIDSIGGTRSASP